MNEYDFSTLNDKDFEIIVKDVLNLELNLQLQHFKNGKDKGVDLRFSSSKNDNSIVVQAKHFLLSGYSQLKSTLKTKELPKIKKLAPDRYIVATSLPLSAVQKDELRQVLAPYVLNSNDIIGKEDLNTYLFKYPQIEKKHFKLWFSSTNVLSLILNNAIEGRTKYLIEKLKTNVKYYVVTEKLDDGNKILMKEKLLLITGQPGIGKTTLAELIILEKIHQNYEIYQVENISEAEAIISQDDDKQQLFYFDDFLGANYLEIVNAHKTETQLTRFVDRVKHTPNKYIVLTTRTVILNYAIQRYEQIGRSSLSSNQFELKLNDYNKYDKALILYNHIYFRGLKPEFFEVILRDKFYIKIIQHRNYTPRLIEFITDNNQTKNILPEEYRDFILLNLNYPKEVWRSSFNNQIADIDKCLLLTLFTFEKTINEDQLATAFEERMKYEITHHNQVVNSNQFEKSIKILLNGFITSYLNLKTGIREYTFINPSLADFLISYVAGSRSEKKAIVSTIMFEEQLRRFNQATDLSLSIHLQTILKDRVVDESIIVKDFTNKHTIYSEILCRYCSSVDIDDVLLKHFSSINFENGIYSIFVRISYILYNVGDSPKTIKFIKDNFKIIIENFILAVDSIDFIEEIPEIFKIYEQDYEEFIESEIGQELLSDVAKNILSNTEEYVKHNYKDRVTNMDDVPYYYKEIDEVESMILEVLFPNVDVSIGYEYYIDDYYWQEHIENNTRDIDYEDERIYKHRPSRDEIEEFTNEADMIDDLFSSD